MNDGNWMLYIFILMIVFGRDGEIEGTELWVLMASVFAVLLSENGCLDNLFGCGNRDDDDDDECSGRRRERRREDRDDRRREATI
ncbi:MAG: hypothetical protein RR357_00335 [Clostridia bacterium]